MSDEFEAGQEPAAEGAEEQGPNDKDYQKLQRENQSLRRQIRSLEYAGKYGQEIVDLIPDELPISKWEGFLEKAQGLRTAAPSDAAQQPATEAETTPGGSAEEEAPGLAAVVRTGSGEMATPSVKSARELYEMYQADPDAATREAVAKYRAETGQK